MYLSIYILYYILIIIKHFALIVDSNYFISYSLNSFNAVGYCKKSNQINFTLVF